MQRELGIQKKRDENILPQCRKLGKLQREICVVFTLEDLKEAQDFSCGLDFVTAVTITKQKVNCRLIIYSYDMILKTYSSLNKKDLYL